jgi:hypothetical protein
MRQRLWKREWPDNRDEQQLEFARSEGGVLFSFNIAGFQPVHAACLSGHKLKSLTMLPAMPSVKVALRPIR